MLVIARCIGKRIGFGLPVGKLLLNGFYKQSQDIDVDAGRYGRYHLKGNKSLWVIGFVLIGLFVLSLSLFIATYLNR